MARGARGRTRLVLMGEVLEPRGRQVVLEDFSPLQLAYETCEWCMFVLTGFGRLLARSVAG